MSVLKKKEGMDVPDRKIILLPADQCRTVLVIINKAEQIRHNQLHQLFPKAIFTFLTVRSEKKDNSSGQNFTFHKSDIRFGRVKNERLKDLMAIDFDLLIDLSEHPKLARFSTKLIAHLRAGTFDKTHNYNFDLLVKNSTAIEEIINTIAKQLNLLTLNKNT
ncbi:MAG: hypothetical protein R3279_07920 [Putridiphycobacter sp.]|nr:hypothetical protein [Putridiphycobacter sp.]